MIQLLRDGVPVGAVELTVIDQKQAVVRVDKITYPDPLVVDEIRRRIMTNEDRVVVSGGRTPHTLEHYPEGIRALLELMAEERPEFSIIAGDWLVPQPDEGTVY